MKMTVLCARLSGVRLKEAAFRRMRRNPSEQSTADFSEKRNSFKSLVSLKETLSETFLLYFLNQEKILIPIVRLPIANSQFFGTNFTIFLFTFVIGKIPSFSSLFHGFNLAASYLRLLL